MAPVSPGIHGGIDATGVSDTDPASRDDSSILGVFDLELIVGLMLCRCHEKQCVNQPPRVRVRLVPPATAVSRIDRAPASRKPGVNGVTPAG